jgi:hypothetical protein
MARDVFSWAWSFRSAALVALGWMAFIAGVLVSQVWARLLFLTASRVLPQAVSPLDDPSGAAPERASRGEREAERVGTALPHSALRSKHGRWRSPTGARCRT